MFKTKTFSHTCGTLLLMIGLTLLLAFTPARAQETPQASTRPCRTVSLYVDKIYINRGGDDGLDGDAEWYMDMFVNGSLFEFNDDNVDTGETKPSGSTTIYYTISCWTPPFADLQVALTDNQDPVIVGSALKYTLAVANNGPTDAQSVTLNVNLPSTVTFLEVNHGSCILAGSTVVCGLGSLPASTSASIEVMVRVNTPSSGRITTTASSSLSPANEDPITSNNMISENTDIGQTIFLPIIRK